MRGSPAIPQRRGRRPPIAPNSTDARNSTSGKCDAAEPEHGSDQRNDEYRGDQIEHSKAPYVPKLRSAGLGESTLGVPQLPAHPTIVGEQLWATRVIAAAGSECRKGLLICAPAPTSCKSARSGLAVYDPWYLPRFQYVEFAKPQKNSGLAVPVQKAKSIKKKPALKRA